MKKGSITLFVLLGLVVVILFWGCNVNNKVVKADQNIKERAAQIESNFTRRNDLYKSAIEAIQSSGKFEKGTLEEVIKARASATSVKIDIDDPKSLEAFQNAQAQLQGSFSRLIATSEAYPQLQTTAMFRDLQTEITGTENRFKKSRDDYSQVVKDYNNIILPFPNSLIASFRGWKERKMFEAAPSEKERPNLNIDIK